MHVTEHDPRGEDRAPRKDDADHGPVGSDDPNTPRGTSSAPPSAGPTASSQDPEQHDLPHEPLYVRAGRYAWATIGLAGAFVIFFIVIGRLSLVLIPVILALFPAALLMPAAHWLKRHGVPSAAASILTILGLLGLLTGIFAGLGMSAADDIPALRESLGEGLADLEQTIQDDPLGLGYEFPGFGQLFQDAAAGSLGGNDGGSGDAAGEGGGTGGGGDSGPLSAGGAVGAATTVTEVLAGLLLALVTLFFFLKDEGHLSDGVINTMPRRWRGHAHALASTFWHTTGAYFRGQMLVALVDAVFIGLGLIVLGIPLAIPLAVLVFFGALFPIIGAFVSGGVAVLVALAHAGPFMAVMVLLLVVVVQQVEGNVLQPVIMSNAVRLHPLVVILALTAGSVLLGILGAFLAVPVAAGVARAMDYVREEMGDRDPPPLREIPSHT